MDTNPLREQMLKHLDEAARWFFENDSYSYPIGADPFTYQLAGALHAATVEELAKSGSYTFDWQIDPDVDSSEFVTLEYSDGPGEPYELWLCVMLNDNGEVVESLGAIDFGRDGTPEGENYKRIVEAQLASEQYGSY